MELLEKIFALKQNKTTVKTELLAGLTTFFTMSYLFVISPKILETTGSDFSVLVAVTALVTFLSSILMGFIGNKPYAVAPLLGETAFISYTVVGVMGYSLKTALSAIFLCGILLFFMTILNIRTYIVNKIPEVIKLSFCIGLGMFFAFIALRDMGVVVFTQNPIPIQAGNFADIHTLLAIFCFLLIVALAKKQIKGAVLIAIITTAVIGICIGDVELPSKIISIPTSISSSFMQIDLSGLLSKNFLPVLFVLFLLVNIDTAGALIGLSYKGHSENTSLKRPMIADSLSVILAPVFGTTTTGAYLDSMTGMSAGGRTGLSAVTVGVLFLCGLFFTPILTVIPPYAYAPALLYVGTLMTSVITGIDFDDISEYACSIFIICTMIFTYNIGTGIISGFVIYPILKVLCGQKEKTNPVIWGLFVLSVLYFIFYPN